MNEKLASYLKGYESKYPHQLEARFGRILDKIVELWETPQMEGYFSELMLGGGRSNRQGFPDDVATEIFILSLAYEAIRSKPTDEPQDVWEEGVQKVTIASLSAKPLKSASPPSPKSPPPPGEAKEPPAAVQPDRASGGPMPGTTSNIGALVNSQFETHVAPSLAALTGTPGKAPLPSLPSAMDEADPAPLSIVFSDRSYHWNASGSPYTLGRDKAASITVASEYASRQHARIEFRDGAVYLVDLSRNGTYVTFSGQAEVAVKNQEILLPSPSSGIVSFGVSSTITGKDLLRFTVA